MRRYKESSALDVAFLVKFKSAGIIEAHLEKLFVEFRKANFHSYNSNIQYTEIECGITEEEMNDILKDLKRRNVSVMVNQI